MLLLLAPFPFLLTEIAALPTGWDAGHINQPGNAKFDYVRCRALGK